jgi:alpha-mannosidase
VQFFSFAHEGNNHNHINELNTNFKLYEYCKNDIEGFSEKLGGGAYNYPSLREDVSTAMISRASTGNMFFEFFTSEVPANYNKDEVHFFFLSDIDLNLREPYDILVNEMPLLTFISSEDGSLKILENPGNGGAKYLLIRRDGNGDGIGAFRLTVPTAQINKGERAKIKVQGHARGSNSWFMLFEASDVIQRLKVSAETECAFSIKQSGENIIIEAPSHFAGKDIRVASDGKQSKKVSFIYQNEFSRAVIKAKPPNHSFQIVFNDEVIEMNYPNGDGRLASSDILGMYFYHYKSIQKDSWTASITKSYRPDFFTVYSDFFDRKYENGKVAVLNSSHQDIAWVDRPEVCKILRDTLLLTPILRDAFLRNDYGFDIEDGLMLREYLERHPDSKEQLTELLSRKLISVGATYNCPYEDMYDSEDQVRQLYLGKRWVSKTFGGYESKVYWNVDVPGKTMQYPQILKKAGVDYMVISRHAKGMFYWESPDGSSVFTYSPGHYGNDIIHLSKDIGNKIKYGAEQVVFWDQYFQSSINHTPLLSDQDMLPAIDYSGFIDVWNGFDKVKGADREEHPVYFPTMELMTVDEFLPMAEQYATSIDTIRGERPNVWIYIHGPSHHEALTASRQASKLLPAAEKFLSIAHFLDPDKMPYPSEKIDEAWQAKIYPDHGWGGHDGDITDNLFKEKLVSSEVMSADLLEKGSRFIAGRIETDENIGIPVVLFNSLSWERTDPVHLTLDFHTGKARSLSVLDASGNSVASQLNKVVRNEDGSIRSAELVFIATVPSVGYCSYYIDTKSLVSGPRFAASEETHYENDFYSISLGKGGITQIHDKAFGKDLLDTASFFGAEVFTLKSVGNGAGEFGDIQQPTMVDFDKLTLHNPDWMKIEDGPVFVKYRLRQEIKDAVVEQDLTIYHELKQIFFDTRLLNWTGEMYREFRTAFPVNMENAEISYEVPFGSVKVGKDEIQTAGERYVPLCKDVHPRSVIDWFAACDDQMSITISSSVAAFDWIDPTREGKSPVLQHVLLSSRKSCHWEGNEYSQAGNHSYSYMLTSNSINENAGKRLAKQHNDPIKIIINPDKSALADLPESMSFLSVDSENVIVTAVKKAEDSDRLVIRLYDTEGAENKISLHLWEKPYQLYKSNILEQNAIPISEIVVPKYSIETFMVDLNK